MKKLCLILGNKSRHYELVRMVSSNSDAKFRLKIFVQRGKHRKAPRITLSGLMLRLYEKVLHQLFISSLQFTFIDKTKYEILVVDDINSEQVINDVAMFKPDASFVFGGRIIKPELLKELGPSFNLHLASLPYYRGAADNLTAISRQDFTNLAVTIHKLEVKTDSGSIVAFSELKFEEHKTVYHLRDAAILAGLQLATKFINEVLLSQQNIAKLEEISQSKIFAQTYFSRQISNDDHTKHAIISRVIHQNKFVKISKKKPPNFIDKTISCIRSYGARERGLHVFLYHNIKTTTNPLLDISRCQNIHTDLKVFEDHLQWYRECFELIPMKEALLLSKNNKLHSHRKPFAVLTFDDGFKSIVSVIKKHEFPCTLFLNSRALKHGSLTHLRHYWLQSAKYNDFRIYLNKANLPNATIEQILNSKIEYHPNQIEIIDDAFLSIACEQIRDSESKVFICEEEIVSLTKNLELEIGGHSESHSKLVNQTKIVKKMEIHRNLEYLSELANKKINYFAYPFGGSNDVGHYEKLLLQQNDVFCFSAYGGINKQILPNDIKRIGFSNQSLLRVKALIAHKNF